MWLAAAATVLTLAVPPAPLGAQTQARAPQDRQGEIERELARLRTQIAELTSEEAELAAELTVSRRHRAELDSRLAALDADVGRAEAELGRAQQALDAAEVRHLGAQARLERAQRALRQAREVLRRQAVSAYISRGPSTPHVEVLLAVRDVRHLHEVQAYLRTAAESQQAVVRAHEARRAETEALARELEAARREALDQRDAVAAHRERLRAARAEQTALRVAAAAEVARQEQLLARSRAQRSDYESRRAQLQRESEQIAAELRRRQAGQQPILCGRGELAAPVSGARLSSRFGYRTHPIYGDRRLHAGLDYAAPTGTPITAAGGGTVLYAGWRGGYGNTVIVDHGGALATLYAHLSAIAVREGATVNRGQVVGSVGATGLATGPHLHFEVRVGGAPVDPLGCL